MGKQMGRPSLKKIDKMRRAALRQREVVSELQTVFDVEGDNEEEILAITGPGIRPKSRKTRLKIAEDTFDKMIEDICVHELEEGLQHLPIDLVVDPLLENNTVKKVGRKSKDEFTILDRKLLLASRGLETTLVEWEEAGVDEPPVVKVTDKTGQRHGRTPKTYPQRLLELKKEIIETKTKIIELESKLDNIQLMERQVRIFQNNKREAVKTRKLAQDEIIAATPEDKSTSEYKETSEYKNAKSKYRASVKKEREYEVEIKQLTVRIERFKGLFDHGWRPDQIERINLANPSEEKLQALLKKTEIKIETSPFDNSTLFINESKAIETQEDLQRTEKYLEALKKKQALMQEIKRIEAEMKINLAI